MYVRYFFIFGTIIFGWAWTLSTDSFLLQLALCLPIGFACALVCVFCEAYERLRNNCRGGLIDDGRH